MSKVSFEAWLTRVDELMVRRFGFPSESMPDYCWWDLWDSDLTPREAVQDYWNEEGYST